MSQPDSDSTTTDEISYLERISSAEVTADELAAALAVFEHMPAHERGDFVALTFAMFRHFVGPPGQGLSSPEQANKLTAILSRLEALARVSDRREFGGWSMPGEANGTTLIEMTLLEAAAAEPLIDDAGHAGFDPDTFYKRVMTMSRTPGSA